MIKKTFMVLLELQKLSKVFRVKSGFLSRNKRLLRAVDDVSLTIEKGQTLGLVGESGSGKSTLAKLVLGLIKPDFGEVRFKEESIHKKSTHALQEFRKKTQMIFQDPYGSLNPRMKIRDILSEAFKNYQVGDKAFRTKRIEELLGQVDLPKDALLRYPHEFSGGQRQRIGIARSLALLPEFIVCDEPVSALDVSIQAQILNLLQKLKKEYALTYLFISHDLKVIRYMSDQIAVMYFGRIVEIFSADKLFSSLHPYTQALVEAVPNTARPGRRKRHLARGTPPSVFDPVSGCAFFSRCPYAHMSCKSEVPILRELAPGHRVACHFAEEIPSLAKAIEEPVL